MASLGELVVRIETDLTNFNQGLSDANARMQKTRGALVQGTQQIGRAFTVMGAVIVGTSALSSKAAIDFEDSFAGVRKTVDLTEEGFAELRQNFRDLAKEIPVTVNALSKIGEVVGQLGIKGVENITNFTEVISKLGLTTNIVGEVGALQLARFMGIIGESEKNVGRLGSVIVDLGNKFKTQEAELLDLSLNLASFGSSIGLRSDQVLAFATALKSSGAIAQAASSAFQKVALKLKDAVITGGKDLTTFADISRITTEELVTLFKKDAAEAMVVFLEGLKDIEKQGGSTTQALKRLGLADVRLIREFGKVIPQTDVLREALRLAAIAFDENTALTEEFEKRVTTAASQLKLLRNSIMDVAITVGDIFIPIIKKVIDFIKPIIEKIGDWVDENKKLAEFIILATTAIGGLMLALGPLLIILPPIIMSVLALKSAGLSLVFVLGTIKTFLISIAGVAAAAFVGWKIGEKISEVTKLDDYLSGPDGLFTRFLLKLDEVRLEWSNFLDEMNREAKEKMESREGWFTVIMNKLELLRINLFGLGRPSDLGGEETPAVDLGQITVEGGAVPTPTEEDEESFIGFFERIGTAFSTFSEGLKTNWSTAITYAKTQMISFQDLLNNVVTTFQKGFAKAFSNVILGITTAKEAVKQLGLQLISMVIEFFAEWVIHQLLAKALGAALTAFTIATAALVAQAWAPAAALASLATLGGNAAPAAAALTSTTALASVLAAVPLAEGGIVTKPTLALIGEAGPEAVIPLNKSSEGKQVTIEAPVEITINGNVDESMIDSLTEMIGQNLEEKLRRVSI